MVKALLSFGKNNFYYSRLALAFLSIAFLAACQPFLGSRGKQEVTQVKNPCVVLALPASGPYAPIAAKIKQGAEAARADLKKNGITVDIKNINTESANWLAQLEALPPICAVVGGPLQDKKYVEARKTANLDQRVFFSFLPTLAQGDEGVKAWRFFPGQQDQIDAIVNFAIDQMGIRAYGSFYPSDAYGQRITAMLEKTLAKKHIPLEKASYNPAAPATWANSAKVLIKPHVGSDGKTIVPGTAFEALFVPDSWKRMDSISNSLRANGEDRLVLLGSTLWEQGLSGKQPIKAGLYDLAVFPVAWNRANAPAAMKKGNYNFWTALGFDFINFAGYMGLAARPDAGAVAALAQKTAPMLKALAPMSWDNKGIGHQRMFLYQPTPAGITPLNINKFKQAKTAIAERAALRMQGWGHIDPVTGEARVEAPEPVGRVVSPEVVETPEAGRVMPVAAQPQNSEEAASAKAAAEAPARAPRVATPQQPVQGVMRSTPRPSYKLSLPVRQ